MAQVKTVVQAEKYKLQPHANFVIYYTFFFGIIWVSCDKKVAAVTFADSIQIGIHYL